MQGALRLAQKPRGMGITPYYIHTTCLLRTRVYPVKEVKIYKLPDTDHFQSELPLGDLRV